MKQPSTLIVSATKAEQCIRPYLNGLDHEECWAIFLTASNTVISMEMLSKGTLTETAIDVRTIIRRALLINAKSIILFHNHVSGNPLPSLQDIHFTTRLKQSCNLMDLSLLDHIIVSDKSFYSFSEEKTIQIQ